MALNPWKGGLVQFGVCVKLKPETTLLLNREPDPESNTHCFLVNQISNFTIEIKKKNKVNELEEEIERECEDKGGGGATISDFLCCFIFTSPMPLAAPVRAYSFDNGSLTQKELLKDEVSIPDSGTSNKKVRILKPCPDRVPGIQLMMGEDVIWLHIRYNDLYLLGVKLNEDPWYSISIGTPHFENSTNIGFEENYGALGCGVEELQTCGRFEELRNAFFTIKNYSESKRGNKCLKENKQSKQKKNKQNKQNKQKENEQNKQQNLGNLKISIARIIVTVCETLRFQCVYGAVYHQYYLITPYSVDLIKNWKVEQTRYYNDRDAYDRTLTMAQPRDINMDLVKNALPSKNAASGGPSGTKMNMGTSSTASSSKQLKMPSSSSRSSVKGKGALVEATDADYHKLVSIIDDGIQEQYEINSMKLILDMHFAVCGVYPSRRVHQITPAIIARAVRTSAARGTDPRSAFPEDEWPVHSAKAAINKLLMVTSEETAIESYTEPPLFYRPKGLKC